MAQSRILVVEDNERQRTSLVRLLESEGHSVDSVVSGEDGLARLAESFYDVVLLDLELPGIQGLGVLAAGPPLQMGVQFIVLTGSGSIDVAVEAMKAGAFDFLTKPFSADVLLLTIERALERSRLHREVAELRLETGKRGIDRIVGRSPAIRRVLDLIARVAPTQASVLITGDTGTGKELVARAIHELSERPTSHFVAVNCAALPDSLLESELFGHVKGAFTGADRARRGLVEDAAGGTLFLDEIGDISLNTQVKLLRVLQERVVTPVGGTTEVPVDFRLITSTNRDLDALVATGAFREDLFYRLNVFPIVVPPLADRREDIPLLADFFRLRFAEANGLEAPIFLESTFTRMQAYDWPGNIRELEHFTQRAVIMDQGDVIRFSEPSTSPREEAIPESLRQATSEEGWTLERLEKAYILDVLEAHSGNQTEAARALGINRSTLYRKLVRYQSGDSQG